ncbi:MAG: HEAT repeat domain-containing protein [Kineosporiaceae bacterium]
MTVAVVRVGAASAPELRRDLEASVRSAGHRRRGAIAARALGMVGDVGSVPLLVEILRDEEAGSLRSAAAGALGEIGSPEPVRALLEVLDSADVRLQVAAGRALGAIGDGSAVPGLAEALDRPREHDASRAFAGALRRIGGPGVVELDHIDSPYAAEALALQHVRQGA